MIIDTLKSTCKNISKEELYNTIMNKMEFIKEKYDIGKFNNIDVKNPPTF